MKKYDFIIIAAVLAIAGILFFFLYGTPAHNGKFVTVKIDGAITQTLPLAENRTLEIETAQGNNTLEIKDGYACIIAADCPDKICCHHAPVRRNGESIICLPHRLIISISSTEDNEIDARI